MEELVPSGARDPRRSVAHVPSAVTAPMLHSFLAAGLALSPTQAPQSDTLLADLNVTPDNSQDGSDPIAVISDGETAYFLATGVDGRELWGTDGSSAGTAQVTDLVPGEGWSFPFFGPDPAPSSSATYGITGSDRPLAFLPGAAGVVLFAAEAPGVGVELFRAEGPAGPVSLVADIRPGALSSLPRDFVAHQGELWFLADDGVHGTEVWRTDGTAAGTVLALDLEPGPGSAFALDSSLEPDEGWLATTGNRLLAVNSRTVDFDRFFDLYASDGSPAGTDLIGTFAVATFPTLPFRAGEWANAAGRAVFELDAKLFDFGIWSTDGTAAGTTQILPGDNMMWTVPAGPELYVAVVAGSGTGTELYTTDGTSAGTELLMGPGLPFRSPGFSPGVMQGGELFLQAEAILDPVGSTGGELCATDGTLAGNRLVLDLFPGGTGSRPEYLASDGAGIYFVAEGDPASGRELHRSDGTAAGTTQVFEAEPGSDDLLIEGSTSLRQVVGTASGVVFPRRLPDGSVEPWRADGSGATTLVDIAPPTTESSLARDYLRVGSRVFFQANTEPDRRSVLAWGPAGAGAPFVASPAASLSFFGGLERFGDGVAYSALDPLDDAKCVWWTDGVSDYRLSPVALTSGPSRLTAVGDRLYFQGATDATGPALFVSGGQPFDAVPVDLGFPAGFAALDDSLAIDDLAALGESLLIVGELDAAVGRELHVSDGTAAGTVTIELTPGPGDTNIGGLVASGDRAFFIADVAGQAGELWVTDGTVSGTVPVSSFGAAAADVRQMEPFRDGVLLLAEIATSSPGQASVFAIYSDGSPSGTVLLTPTTGVDVSSAESAITVAGGTAYFQLFFDGQSQVYRTDGTPAGTLLVPGLDEDDPSALARPCEDTIGNPGSFSPLRGAVGEGVVTLHLQNTDGDCDLWLTDGTLAGTYKFVDTTFELENSATKPLVRVGSKVVFSALTYFEGIEVHAADLVGSGVAAIESVGTGCGSAAGGLGVSGPATVGQAFDFTLDTDVPGSVAAVYVDQSLAPLGLPGACTILLASPDLFAVAGTDGTGAALVPASVPPLPELSGALVYAQGVVVVPGGPFLGLASFSNALELLIGG